MTFLINYGALKESKNKVQEREERVSQTLVESTKEEA
jgi:hypothetical protein